MLVLNGLYMLEKNIADRLKRCGEPQGGAPLTAEQLEYAQEHLPLSFVGLLEEYGFGGVFDNGWQLCDPIAYRPLAAMIFKADPDFSHKNAHIVGFSAFGQLAIWSEEHWIVTVDLLKYELTCARLAPPVFNIPIPTPTGTTQQVTANTMARGLLPFELDAREFWDRDGAPLFSKCVKKYGALELGQCYGFVPSLGATGYHSKFRSLEHIQRLSALEHFSIISQFKPLQLTRLNMGVTETVREIG